MIHNSAHGFRQREDMEVCMQCIPTYRDLCVDGSWWNLVGF